MKIEEFKKKYSFEYYKYAQITLITGKGKGQKKPDPYDLIWGCIELLHPESPVPVSEPFIPGESSSYRYFAHRAVVSVDQALLWLDGLLCSHSALLINKNNNGFTEDSDKVIATGEFLSEPSWPSLTTMSRDSRFGIIPLDLESPLVCSMWQDDLNAIHELDNSTQAKLKDWVKKHVGIDLGIDKKLLGSVHLIVNNPVFRKVELRLKPNEDFNDRMNILIKTVLRENDSYCNITLILLDKRDTGWKLLYCGSVESSIFEVIPEECEHPREVMAMMFRGNQLLYISGPHTFIYSLSMGFSVVTGTRKVIVKNGFREEGYSVDLRTSPEISNMGIEPPIDGLSVLRKMRNRVLERERRNRFDQVYLHGNQEKATEMLRKILTKGNKRILFVDPYFSLKEFANFALAVSCIDSKIEILSSTEIVKGCDGPKKKIEMYKSIKAECERISQQIDFRIMGTGIESIHDRFILCDDKLWILGSSLNAYGTRGTMLVRLPQPRSVIPELDRVWKKAKNLEERIDEIRKKNKGKKSDKVLLRRLLVTLKKIVFK